MSGSDGGQEETPDAPALVWSSGSLSRGPPATMVIITALAVAIAFGAGMYTARYDQAQSPWRIVSLLRRPTVGDHQRCLRPLIGTEPAPAVLEQLFVMITFHFDAAHLAWLAQARSRSPHRLRLLPPLARLCLTAGTAILLSAVGSDQAL